MRDRWAVALAIATAAGARWGPAVPLAIALLVAAGALLVRHPSALCVAGLLLASCLAHRSLAGLDGVQPGVVEGVATLLTDPEPGGGGLRAEVRLSGRHLQVQASDAVAGTLREALAGERIDVRGELEPLAHRDDWAMSRHLAGRMTLLRWSPGPAPGAPVTLANGLRRSLARGAEVLVPRDAALFGGLVVGDDRAQPPDLADDFGGAGLTHLLAVSGQNVAFVLVLLGVIARRLRLWPRLGLTLCTIALFALLTRFEPSVSRASAMAALAVTTVTIGSPLSRLRTLVLGVTVLLLVDPLLVRSLGFQLSVSAALSIVVAAEPLARALPGPRWLVEPMAVTAAAQLGVAPLLLAAFGPLPVASLPANLLAVPAAGLVMVWGMTAGLLAGAVPAGGAELLHLPTRPLLWWIEGVAARSARAPLGQVGWCGVLAIAAGLGLLVVGQRIPWRAVRSFGGVVVAGALLIAVVSAQAPPALREALRPGVVRWHGPGTDVVAVGGGSWQTSLGAEGALEALRTAGVGAVDLLIAVDDDVPEAVVAAIRDRHPTAAVLVPATMSPADRPPDAVVLPALGTALEVGTLTLLITPGEDRLVVEAWPHPNGGERAVSRLSGPGCCLARTARGSR